MTFDAFLALPAPINGTVQATALRPDTLPGEPRAYETYLVARFVQDGEIRVVEPGFGTWDYAEDAYVAERLTAWCDREVAIQDIEWF